MANVSMKKLLESGVHFGHRTHKWNPNMKPYIFTERNGIHIIDLQQTVKAVKQVYGTVRDISANGGTILFVGTKRQAQDTIQTEADRSGMPYVTVRWLGGMLTNWRTMRDRINELERLERMRDRGDFDRLTKKEALTLTRQIDKLQMRFGGIRYMANIPDALFIVDIRREETAVKEANILGIPVIALVDTNCDPRDIDHVIPSNDDAIRAIKLLVGHMADAVIEGKDMRKDDDAEEGEMPVSVVSSDHDELSDEDLLGASTLAKMEETAEAEAGEAVEEATEAAEETAAEVVEEAAEAVEETATEEAPAEAVAEEEEKKEE